ncbi:MAG: 3-phosphoshikimate 1-carboxyvinyltransferase [Erysipelotrichaceae bacterium]
MKAKIYPGNVAGTVTIPASKSMAHRSIIAASLANAHSTITNVQFSDDIRTTITGMINLGANIIEDGSTLEIDGIKDFNSLMCNEIDANESGSTLRFFIPIFSLTNERITFIGKNRLMKRPQGIYEDLFKEQNLVYEQNADTITIEGALSPNNYVINGNVSSQFITGLLYTLPLLNGDSSIKILPPFESRSYVDLTIQMLAKFGISVSFKDDLTLTIPGNQSYKGCNYCVEGDFSQMAFFACLAAINNTLSIKGMDPTSKQGDKAILNTLTSSNVNISLQDNIYTVFKSPSSSASAIDLKNCPDLGPILCSFACCCSGNTRIYNASRLRYKESDRILAMEEELHKLNVDITSTDDEININSNHIESDGCLNFSGHKDHRIVMALAILATVLHTPSIIDECEYISKSYPSFFEDLRSVGIKVDIYED